MYLGSSLLLFLPLSGLEVLPDEEYQGKYNEEAKERDNDNYRKKVHCFKIITARRGLLFHCEMKQNLTLTDIHHLI